MYKRLKRGSSSSNASTADNLAGMNVPPSKKLRKYQDEFLHFGFICKVVDNEERPQCVICREILAHDSLKPSKLKRHLCTKHSDHQAKAVDFFQRHADKLQNEINLMNKFVGVQQKAQRASIEISCMIGKQMKPYNIGETLVLPAAIKMCQIMHGDKYSDPLKIIPLSRDTVKRRICDVAEDIKMQLLTRVRLSGKFAIQVDETTDIVNLAQLMVFIRYTHAGIIEEDMLFCHSLDGRTTGLKIFECINSFFEKNNLSWTNCLGLCSDGAASMVGYKKGLRAQALKVAPKLKFSHCIIHREALVAKNLPPEASAVLNDVIKIVNFVKARPLQSRLFSILCSEMGSEFDNLLLHTEVRWLSRGRVLRRVYELKSELQLFLLDNNPSLAAKFTDEKWVLTLCYLCDIFEKLNDLNLSLQGMDSNILVLGDKILAFTKKLTLWKYRIEGGNRDMFPCLTDFVEESRSNWEFIDCIIISHLDSLISNITKRFPDIKTSDFDWIRDPFVANAATSTLTVADQEQLIDLANDSLLHNKFKMMSLTNFWLSVNNEYHTLSEQAMEILLPFASSYLCEVTFSRLTTIKSKLRSRVDVEPELRLSVSNITPRYEEILAGKQAHCSH